MLIYFVFFILAQLASTFRPFHAPFQALRQSLNQLNAHQLLTDDIATLSTSLGGSGRAKSLWEHLRVGEDPLSSSMEQSTANTISPRVRAAIREIIGAQTLLSNEVIAESLSPCGTRKMLLRLSDGMEIESVLIPGYKFERTTLCVSTQIGCDRGCAFCLTGTMGLVRNLTATEIIGQVIRGLEASRREHMPTLTNVVFMGMGDAGRNLDAVAQAVDCLTDPLRLGFAQSKVTVSTVGPSPEVFKTIATMPAAIAWSLHSPDDVIRRRLVPSTRHTTIELRDGLIAGLLTRTMVKKRTMMVAITLIEGVNDREEDADKVGVFLRPLIDAAKKVMVDLIPYNDINVHGFKRPSRERVNAFQRILVDRYSIFTSVRVTRGDEEYSACGMLATKRGKKQSPTIANVADVVEV